MTSIDDEWSSFLNGNSDEITFMKKESVDTVPNINAIAPECEDLYISTTTKVLFLNRPIDIDTIFWKLPVIDYTLPTDGIVKKQMKIISKTPEEFEKYAQHLKNIKYYNEYIIKKINNPTARRMKFKDERKITIGISKKDIMNCRGKVKNAFYNCFALIMRFLYEGVYKEIHVKVFNTGKLEIPGILNENLLNDVKDLIITFIQPHIDDEIYYIEKDMEDNVLINSNFNCGYFINRDKLYSIVKGDKYRIETAYDPCSYPGVKCKFYFNNHKPFDKDIQKGLIEEADRNMKQYELDDNKKYTEISFMVFRTGSCLIVGNCTEKILRFVYEYIKTILQTEYCSIYSQSEIQTVKQKQPKIRKKTIVVSNAQYKNIVN